MPSKLNPITGESTIRSLQTVLPINDLASYRRILTKCPSIEQYIWFRDSTNTTAGFDVYFRKDKIKMLMQSHQEARALREDTASSSFHMLPNSKDVSDIDDEGSYQSCFGSNKDFKTLWMHVCFIINTFAMEQPTHVIAIW
jgi:hypothetical protein